MALENYYQCLILFLLYSSYTCANCKICFYITVFVGEFLYFYKMKVYTTEHGFCDFVM